MYYRDLIQFQPLESIVKLREADNREKAFEMLDTYVISERMAEQLDEILIEQLQFERFVDNKGILIVGNYGTGKSHLMGVISTIAEIDGASEHLSNPKVAAKAKEIEGKFKVIRTEMSSTKMSLRDFICGELEDHLAEMGVDYEFPPIEKVRSNKDNLIEMMGTFHEEYPDHGLLLVVDELLDYLHSRNDQDRFLDLGFLREIGEICNHTKFRFIAGIQEMLFDNPKFQFVSDQLRRVKERFEQVSIVREDLAYVASQRLLKKDDKQKALIREHLQKFTKLYGKLNEELEQYVELFPIHPSYLSTFENVMVTEKRVALKTISSEIKKLLDQQVPNDQPGLVSYDSYWTYMEDDKSLKSNPDIRNVMNRVKTLKDRVQHSKIPGIYRPISERIINALAVFRLTTDDIQSKIGLTSEELRDGLFLYMTVMDDDDDAAGFLRTNIEAALREILKAVSYQFISVNEDNGQFYIDLEKVTDFDALIREKAEVLSDTQLDRYFFELFSRVTENSRDSYTTGYRIWQYELPWYDRNVTRQGYLFFGAPNERSTAQPERDFYLYVLQPFDPPKFQDEKKPDEVFFKFINKDPEFIDKLKLYAAAREMSASAESRQKKTYEDKAQTYMKYCTTWFIQNMPTAFKMTYQGITKKLGEWSTFAHHKASVKEIMDEAAADCLDSWFNDRYPDYPSFKKVDTPITHESLKGYVAEALRNIADPKTKNGKAILNGLVLLDQKEKVDPRNSGYTRWILDLLDQKGHGQVINNSELIETAYQHGTQTHQLSSNFKLEPELLLVVLSALVYSGDIVITINGTTYDALKLDQLVKLPLQQLLDFTHIKKPSELPLREWEGIFELLNVNTSLLRTALETGITQAHTKVDVLINEVLTMNRELVQGIVSWDGQSLTSTTDQERLDQFKQFLEGLQKFNTPAKAKNLRYSLAEIQEQKATLEKLEQLQELKKKVQEWTKLAQYLVNAQNLLPTSHEWQKKANEALQELLVALKNGRNGRAELRQAEDLKKEYQIIYLDLHNKARLNATEENQKMQLLQDQRYIVLNQLQIIRIIPKTHLESWQNRIQSLQICYQLTRDKLDHNVQCPFCKFRPANDTMPKTTLDELEDELQTLLDQWTQLLVNNIETEEMKENIELLSPEQQDLVHMFLSQKALDLPVDSRFLQAIKELLQGIDRVQIPVDHVIQMMGDGAPLTLAELRKRFDQLITAYVGSQPKTNVRIMLDKEEE
ncbi:DUF6079 family protein [Risungbinella massiliensis]|uniref:DUF6079 family protein n=1 Tax=Risungbinella massiliensis TaxID=1329796 RepID=UPI0005CC6862|nr:DUF6079 family protein [Risungbinella massiliensis]